MGVLSFSPMVPWLYKLSCTESRRFNSYFSLFLSFSKKKKNKNKNLMSDCCRCVAGKKTKSYPVIRYSYPDLVFFFLFFISLSLSFLSVWLSLPSVSLPLCIQSTLLHDFIKRITILSILLFLVFFFFFFFFLALLDFLLILSYIFLFFLLFFFFFLQFWLVSSHFRMACIWIIYALFTNNFSLSSFK